MIQEVKENLSINMEKIYDEIEKLTDRLVKEKDWQTLSSIGKIKQSLDHFNTDKKSISSSALLFSDALLL